MGSDFISLTTHFFVYFMPHQYPKPNTTNHTRLIKLLGKFLADMHLNRGMPLCEILLGADHRTSLSIGYKRDAFLFIARFHFGLNCFCASFGMEIFTKKLA